MTNDASSLNSSLLFILGFLSLIVNASFRRRLMGSLSLAKTFTLTWVVQSDDPQHTHKCLNTDDALLVRCSCILVCNCLIVLPIYTAEQTLHRTSYTTFCRRHSLESLMGQFNNVHVSTLQAEFSKFLRLLLT